MAETCRVHGGREANGWLSGECHRADEKRGTNEGLGTEPATTVRFLSKLKMHIAERTFDRDCTKVTSWRTAFRRWVSLVRFAHAQTSATHRLPI